MSHYKRHVFFCCNQRTNGKASCNDHGANYIRESGKGKVQDFGLSGKGKCRVNSAGCMDRCEEGPVMVVYPDGVWFIYFKQKTAYEIIHEHIENGRVVERLKI